MLMTSTTVPNRVTPFWNEIKNWNREDRNYLAKLLETSLEEDDAVNFASNIPGEYLEMASEYAIRESHAGRSLPHSEAMKKIREKRGWK